MKMVEENGTNEAAKGVITLDDAIRDFSVQFDLEPLQRALEEKKSNEIAKYLSGKGPPVANTKYKNGVYKLSLVLYSDAKRMDVMGIVTERADN